MRQRTLWVAAAAAVLVLSAGCAKKVATTDLDKPATNDYGTQTEPPPTTTPTGSTGTDTGALGPLALTDIYFDYDDADIRYDAKTVLDENAGQLTKHASARVLVEGHCDERGTPEYNLALGQRRAHSTMQYLVRKGVDSSRLSTVSYGEERPVDASHDESAWAKNRRAHFVVQK